MNLSKLRAYRFATVRQTYTAQDSILYALGLNCGADPLDPGQLQFVYERGQKAVPSQCVVLGYAGPWMALPELEIDFSKILHGEQRYEIHRPFPPSGTVEALQEIVAVVDKGPGKGAAVHVRKDITDEAGHPLATTWQTLMMRGDGGCGSFGEPPPQPTVTPAAGSKGAEVYDMATLPQQALLYRLSGDMNPLHADPAVAARAGFDRPILMGLCAMGMATLAAVRTLCADRPEGIKAMSLRFRQPIYPGETLRFTFIPAGTGASALQVHSVERGLPLMDNASVHFN